MKVLVTGALGFVGLNCVRDVAAQKLDVLALTRREPDRASLSYLEDFSNVRWLIGDVTNQDHLIESIQTEQVTHILHAAAMTASPSEERKVATRMFEVNAGGTLNILEAAREAKVERVVFISSSGLYAICKQTSEHLCQRYAELYGLSTAVGRLGTTYGPMERASKSRQGMSAIHRLAELALPQKHIKVHGSQIARDFCHSDDIASAFTELLLSPTLSHAVYNVAASQAYPLSDALKAVAEVTLGFSWEEVDDPKDADLIQTAVNARAGMSVARLQADTNWQPNYDLTTGMKVYLNWLNESTP